MNQLCDWTNAYAASVGEQRKSMYARWSPVERDDFYRFGDAHVLGESPTFLSVLE